jgi:glycosyltransferase involved in cell wall biosynthesis
MVIAPGQSRRSSERQPGRGVTVSVVIPAYNASSVIGRTLDTVRAQTFATYETILVDDGSTDGTADFAEAYFARYRMRGRVVRQGNRGVSAARNTGMRVATGAYVALLDSDDLWSPEKLTEVMREFERYPDAELICHDERITRDGRCVRITCRSLPSVDAYRSLLFDGNVLSPSATIVRREAALALGGFDERTEYQTVEDYDFWMRFSRERPIRFLNRVLGEYVLHERSASRRIVYHHIALERMLQDHLTAYLRSRPTATTRWRARRRMAQVYRSAARQLMAYREDTRGQRGYVARMLRTYPFELRNVAVALLWVVSTLRRGSVETTLL